MVKIQSHLLAFILEIIVSYVHRAIPAFDAVLESFKALPCQCNFYGHVWAHKFPQTCQSQNLIKGTSTRKPYIWGENL